MKKFTLLLSLSLSLPCALHAAESSEKPGQNSPEWSLGLQELDLSGMTQGFGAPQLNKSIGGKPLSIGGRVFEKGLGTHSPAEVAFDLHGTARRFSAWVGVDDGAQAPGSVSFRVVGDGRVLWESGVMKAGEPAKEVSVDLTGVRRLMLLVGNGGDTNGM
ncbi:MAG: NPCBM/NEW2 domain-containing protein, partial [Spartobacteria bacterium]